MYTIISHIGSIVVIYILTGPRALLRRTIGPVEIQRDSPSQFDQLGPRSGIFIANRLPHTHIQICNIILRIGTDGLCVDGNSFYS